MGKKKRTFSKEEKLKILKEASEGTVKETMERYGLYPATYYSWKKKFEEMGEKGFDHGMTKKQLKEIKRLEKENAALKNLLAEKELEGHLQQELLKKSIHICSKTFSW